MPHLPVVRAYLNSSYLQLLEEALCQVVKNSSFIHCLNKAVAFFLHKKMVEKDGNSYSQLCFNVHLL